MAMAQAKRRWKNTGDSEICPVPDLKKVLLKNFHDKKIPIEYLRASVSQRFDLLQGLMDSDGAISNVKGQAIYTSTEKALAESVSELLWGLGIKNTITTAVSTQRTDWSKPSRECGRVATGETLYYVKFTAFDDMPIAGLKRKMKNAIRTIATVALAFALVGCSSTSTGSTSTKTSSEDKTIKVGATAVPHAEILNNVVKDVLAKDGWTLEVTEFTDYVTPNTALEEGSLDANYFQTLGYMNDQNSSKGLHLAAAVGVHIEPMGIYSATVTDIKDLKDGATISLPNDADNLDRGLRVLVQAGLLEDPGTDEYVTETTFNGNKELNPHNYDIQPVEAAQVPLTLEDVDAVVANGNYALEADLPSKHPAIYVEQFDQETSVKRTNYIVVKDDNLDTEKTKALVKAITSDEVKSYIEDTYKGSVIASFIDTEGNPVD